MSKNVIKNKIISTPRIKMMMINLTLKENVFRYIWTICVKFRDNNPTTKFTNWLEKTKPKPI